MGYHGATARNVLLVRTLVRTTNIGCPYLIILGHDMDQTGCCYGSIRDRQLLHGTIIPGKKSARVLCPDRPDYAAGSNGHLVCLYYEVGAAIIARENP